MEISQQVPLAPFTTFKVGGPAAWYCSPTNEEELQEAFLFASSHKLPLFCLGGGSNVLAHDSGFPGLVIHLAALEWIQVESNHLHCGAGAAMSAVTRAATDNGLSGLEFAGGLPGSIGGAAFMNARAYGSSMEGILESVKIMDRSGNTRTLFGQEMEYSYKQSRLMESEETAFEITLKLTRGDKERIKSETMMNREKRITMGQFRFPNAGCVFKNNYYMGVPSGKLIDECGLLGLREGGAAVFESHGNFIVNLGNATAADIRKLIEKIRSTVLKKKGVLLEEEIRYLGFPETGNQDGNQPPE